MDGCQALSGRRVSNEKGSSALSREAGPVEAERQSALLVMAKEPVPGGAKTRLAPPLTEEQAASLYHCFLQDTLATVRSAARLRPFTAAIAYTPTTARAFFRGLAPDFELFCQQPRADESKAKAHRGGLPIEERRLGREGGGLPPREDDSSRPSRLAERLNHVLVTALDRGYRRVVAINSDSPTLPEEILLSAFRRLEDRRVDVVLGPCADGGYYLIGVKRPPGRLVTGVEMSTPMVLRDTLAMAAGEGVRVELLQEWYDVDGAEELERLRGELAREPRRAPATDRFLAGQCVST